MSSVQIFRSSFHRILERYAGKIEPNVHRTYALEETPAALQAIARREVIGKAIVVI